MWRVYGRDRVCVAVVTTVGNLRAIFSDEPGAVVGSVVYEQLPKEIADIHTLFFHKRNEYAEEREVRSVNVLAAAARDRYVQKALTAAQLDGLLTEIVSGPGMRETMSDALLQTVQSRFSALGLSFDPERLKKTSLDRDLLT
jgi:hypothetical protein